jgi:hypothetical protein
VDLLALPADDEGVKSARAEMVSHPKVRELVAQTATWGERALKRHNDASHPIYAFSTLADFGLVADDPGLDAGIEAVMAHQSPEGPFQTVVLLPKQFGGSGKEEWSWILCDAPTLLYALLGYGLGKDPRVQRAVAHLERAVDENGWHCLATPDLGTFKGPGRREDPCPIVNVYALKALALVPDLADSSAIRAGAEMLLSHWECQRERKMFLFGIGTDYRKLKYPYVWYNLLHVVEVLSRFPFVYDDARFLDMVEAIVAQADAEGRFTATSMYRAWKDWSFADKKHPSPWLTFLCCRVLKRLDEHL